MAYQGGLVAILTLVVNIMQPVTCSSCSEEDLMKLRQLITDKKLKC